MATGNQTYERFGDLVHRRGFWLLQLAVLAIYVARAGTELAILHRLVPSVPDLSTLGLFLVPTLVAAVVYGPVGGSITVAWVAALSTSRYIEFAQESVAGALVAEAAQILALWVIAVVVGQRVAAERGARLAAEQARSDHLAAEARYRELFATNASPILLADRKGTVLECNDAARRAFAGRGERGPEPGTALSDLVGPDAAKHLLAGEPVDVTVAVGPAGRELRLRTESTVIGGAGGTVQVVCHDVTSITAAQRAAEGYASSVLQAQEEERRHIAQELHDGPLQDLVLVCRQVDSARQHPMVEEAASSLDEVRQSVLGVIEELRKIARGLRPSMLDDLGMVAAIGRLLDEASERTGIETELEVCGDQPSSRRLPAAVELTAFRIAQEAISNAEQHSGADRIWVGIELTCGELRLTVSDDGSGFSPAHTIDRGGDPGADSPSKSFERGKGLGISGMRERAQLSGGQVVIHSAPDSGTTVELTVPLRQ